MDFIKIYFNVLGMAVVGTAFLRFIWPFLFSADSTELVAIGVVSVILVPPLYFMWGKKVVDMFVNGKRG